MGPRLVCLIGLLVSVVAQAADSRPEILDIPYPDLATAEPAVRETLTSARSSLDAILEAGEAAPGELATAFGEMGELYHSHHVYVPADPCYGNATSLAPEEFRWPYYHGYLMQRTGQPERAVESYRRARSLRPEYAPARLRLAQALLEFNRPREAAPLFSDLQDVASVADAARYGSGRILLAQGQAAEAAELFEQVLESQPEAGKVRYSLGMAYRSLGRIDEARAQLAQHGEGEPRLDDPELARLDELSSGVRTLLYQAIAAVQAGHHERAVTAFREALEGDPENVNARVSLARSLYLTGEREASRRELDEVLRRDPGHVLANFFLGVWLRAAGEREAAGEWFETTLSLDPGHGGAHHFLANYLMFNGEYATAAEHFAAAVAAMPEDSPARAGEAVALLHAGTPQAEVRQRLELALKEAPGQPQMEYMLARLLAASPDEAARDGGEAVVLAQAMFDRYNVLENAEILAMAYAEAGRFEDAAALQENALNAAAAAGRFEVLPRLQQNLDRYRDRLACREPFTFNDPMLFPVPMDPQLVFREYPTKEAY